MSRFKVLVVALLSLVCSAHAEQPTRNQLDSLAKRALQIQVLIDAVKLYTIGIPAEVTRYMQLDPADPGAPTFGQVISQAYGQAAQMNQVSAIIWSVFSGVFNSWSTAPPASIGIPKSYEDRFDKSMFELRGLFAQVHDSPAAYWSKSYKLPFTITVDGVQRDSIRIGELWNVSIPQYGTTEYQDFLRFARVTWRKEITKLEAQKKYRIAYPYFIAQTCSHAKNPEQDNRFLIRQDWILTGGGGWIVSKLDERHGGIGKGVGIKNVGPDGSMQSFYATLKRFYDEYEPGCYVHARVDDAFPEYLSYYVFYLVPKGLAVDECNWHQLGHTDRKTIVDVGKWLFIDDGYGNVINGDGVVNRLELYRGWKLDGYKGITENVTVSVNEPDRLDDIRVAIQPNPAASIATVTLDLPYGQVDAAIYDVTGQRAFEVFRGLYSGGNTQIPVQLESLTSGSYTLRVVTEAGVYARTVIVK